MLRPQVSVMTMAGVAFTAIAIRRILSQPMTIENTNERFRNKPIDVTFVETSTGNHFEIPQFRINDAKVTEIMVKHISATMNARHTSIAQFCAFFKGRKRACTEFKEAWQNKWPLYVDTAVQHDNKKHKGCEVKDYEKDLEDELRNACEEYEKEANECC